jgi:hypothetical protein
MGWGRRVMGTGKSMDGQRGEPFALGCSFNVGTNCALLPVQIFCRPGNEKDTQNHYLSSAQRRETMVQHALEETRT